MAINFPTSLDNFTNPTASDTLESVDHAGQHSNLNDAVEALEAKVGVNSSLVATSLDYRVTQLESAPASGVWGGITGTLSNQTDLQTALNGKADSSLGVTNGNSHDHSGGDGAQIAYSNLSGLPTLGTAAAANTTDFATAAKGVTNGDSHDHSGGDGAQIDHGGLAGLADDDHTQYHTDARGDARYVQLASVGPSFKNKIIGGDFTTNPWQRGTSLTGATDSSLLADRWRYITSNDAVVNYLKTADAPTVAQAGVFTQHCLHLDVTTADASIGATQYAGIFQRVEGYNAASFGFGQPGTRYVTLSFWHKHTKTGIYSVTLNATGSTRVYISEYTQDVSDTWEKAVVTVPVDTGGTWLYDNGIGVGVVFWLAGGTNYHKPLQDWTQSFGCSANQVNALDSTANNFKLALVQLEAGSTATSFDVRDVGTELALCQRYYEKSFSMATTPAANVGTASGAACFMARGNGALLSYSPAIYFAVRKRTAPSTMGYYNPLSTGNQAHDPNAGACSSTATWVAGEKGFIFNTTTHASTVAGSPIVLHWTADAEL